MQAAAPVLLGVLLQHVAHGAGPAHPALPDALLMQPLVMLLLLLLLLPDCTMLSHHTHMAQPLQAPHTRA